MSEFFVHLACFALGYAMAWIMTFCEFSKTMRRVAKVYENGDLYELCCKIKKEVK